MRIILVLTVLAAAACSRRSKPEPAARAPVVTPAPKKTATAAPSPARSLVGSYRFTAVNKAKVPAEFPAGSGARLESGSLELLSGNRFVMRFASRGRGATEPKTSGESGRYRIGRDTLYFIVDGQDTRPPVTFRFTRTSAGLNLIDSKGNTWAYARQ
jgi:hypothetical protein